MSAAGRTRVVQRRRKPAAGHDSGDSPAAAFVDDHRPETIAQRELVDAIHASPPPGLPERLKSRIESLSGMSMDGVKVHYNSSRPAQLDAAAYAQGPDIHVAPGQERHLPHEAWHAVQQAQGRVGATMKTRDGVPVNDDPGLEREADAMGARAAAAQPGERAPGRAGLRDPRPAAASAPVQRVLLNIQGFECDDNDIKALKATYAAQAAVIDKHHDDDASFIVREHMNGTITFQKYVKIASAPEHSRLKRSAFDKQTQDQVKLGVKGYHRRHIIPHHLMKLAIDAWQGAHPKLMTLKRAQEILDGLNNYQPNLIPGPGAENSAIGMFTTSASGKLGKAEKMQGTMPAPQFSANLAVNLGQYSGFQLGKQSELIDPVLPVFGSDAMEVEPKAALDFAWDLQFSTDFDWPEGAKAKYYDAWRFAYGRFKNMHENPGGWSAEQFQQLIAYFTSLPNPTK